MRVSILDLDIENTSITSNADSLVVDISETSAGNTLVRLEALEGSAVGVEVRLELVVNLLAVLCRQSLLLLVVANSMSVSTL